MALRLVFFVAVARVDSFAAFDAFEGLLGFDGLVGLSVGLELAVPAQLDIVLLLQEYPPGLKPLSVHQVPHELALAAVIQLIQLAETLTQLFLKLLLRKNAEKFAKFPVVYPLTRLLHPLIYAYFGETELKAAFADVFAFLGQVAGIR